MGKLINDNLRAATGVYGIYNNENKLIYVGQSVDCAKRYSNHHATLKSGNHSNKLLQEVYDSGGELEMKAIQYTDTQQEAIDIEHEMISNCEGLLNIKRDIGKVVRYSEESRQRMSMAQRGSNNGNAKLSVADVAQILEKLKNGEKQCDIAKQHDIHPSYVSSIATNKKWKNIIHRFMGDGTRPPIESKLNFTLDEETSNIILKLKELGRVDLLWKIQSKLEV